MVNDTAFRRILYVVSGFVITVVLILAVIVIPSVLMDTSPHATPESAVPAISVVVIIHLLIVAALIWTIIVKKRGGQINKELLVAAGVIPIILSLLILDGAFAYIDNPDTHVAGISMFICVISDLIAGVLTLISRYSKQHHRISD
jgi:hypothetical protein